LPARKKNDEFIDGFNWKTVVGAFFVGMVMMPASIYISLFSGSALSGAAEWVTIILFAELARRSISALKKQEVYVLYHVAGGLAGGGVFYWLIWNQFLRQSREAAAFGVAQNIPVWAAPAADSVGILARQLWHPDWFMAIGLILVGQVLVRLNWFGLGYVLFRLTSDLERLPFPLSIIAAEGATALAESPEKKESWRWRVFSTGAMIGLAFGILYIGLPALTGLVFTAPMVLFPIPWLDFTVAGENVLPSAPLNISFDLGSILTGMVLPFWMIIGWFLMTMATSIIGNPILQHLGFFPTWKKGMSIISTQVATNFDFWLSVSIGVAFSVATVGIIQITRTLRARKKEEAGQKVKTEADILMGTEGHLFIGSAAMGKGTLTPPKGRGDYPIWLAILMFLVAMSATVWICHRLVPNFPLAFLLGYAFIWTPLTSYISARMIGLTGNMLSFPFVREGSFILSGYKGVDIWFAPIPMYDFGWVAPFFKQLELTKTKFTSIIKAELLMMPINIIFSFVFWAFFWHLAAIPSSAFPYVDKIWPFNAINTSLFMTATMEGRQWLLEAIKPVLIGVGFAGGLGLYGVIAGLRLPVFLFYGAAAGVANMPNYPILLLVGALLGRFYFARRLGTEKWFRYIPVLGAGFACGAGLIAMLVVGIIIVTGSVVTKPF